MSDDDDEPYFSTFPYSWQELISTINYYGNNNKGSDWENEVMYENRELLWEYYDYANE